jgi:hypothetical protein
MPYNHGAGVTPVKFFEQSSHGSLLHVRSRIGGLTADVEPALVADANRVGIVVLAVGTDHPFRTAWLYRSVSSDHVVVADTELPALSTMPRVYLSGRARLVRPHRRTVNDNQRYRSHKTPLQLATKNVVITRVINDPVNFRILPIA